MKLTVEKMVYGGAGLARHEGKAIFIPGTLPGEVVEAALAKQKHSFAEAELLAVLQTSPDRVAATCPYYGVCGGCQYQHASYPAQLQIKREILLETLARGGLRDLPEIVTHAGEPWAYRNRIRLHVEPGAHALGYLRRGSHRVLPVDTCPIAAPVLQQALRSLRFVAAEQQLGDWCAAADLFTNHDGSALLLQLEGQPGARTTQRQLDRLSAALAEHVPELRGSALTHAAARTKSRQQRGRAPARRVPQATAPAAAIRCGSGALTYRAAGSAYRVSAGAFFQTNRFLVDDLAELATADAAGGLAWDLFAGVGLFARALSQRCERVVAVEGAPISAADLRHNLPEHKVVESSTLTFLSRAVEDRPDLVVLDPPRAGLGTEASAALARVRSQSITYVSCDPATLARDLASLAHAGYTITRLDLIDMFPQTFHLETVAKLRLR